MLVVKSVPRAARAKSFFAALSVLLMIAATLFGANVGQASSATAVTKQSLKTCVNTVSGSVYLRTGRLCNSKTGTTVKWFRSVKPTAGMTVVTLVSCVKKKTRSTRLARSTRCKPRTEKKVVWSRLVTTPVESEVVGQDPSATEPAAASVPVITSLRQTSATTIEVSFSMTSTRTTTRDGGVTTYTVTASTSSGERSATGTTSPITVTGLTQYTAYTFIVTATGADGSRLSSETSPPVTTPYAPVPGPPTPASPVVTPVTVPGAPTSVVGVSGNTTVALTWVAPTSTGGTAITGYSVHVSTSSGGSYTDATGCATASSSTAVTCTATGLTNGTAYYFKVAAINSAGTSAYSTASAAVTPATVPGAPTIGAATATGATTATVAFTAPVSDGGSTITTYTATSTPTGGSGTLSSAGSGTITVTGLTTVTSYTFTVTATNFVGTSVASAVSAAVTTTLTCAAGGACVLGDIGPGEGLVFFISGGQTYEMAPKTWSGSSSDDTLAWCSATSTDIPTAVDTAVGTGSANTTAMQSPACSSGAGVSARAYPGGGLTDWFLPSKDELNAMCYYSRNLSASPDPTVSCYGSLGTTQDGTFAAGKFGFDSQKYWSSSQGSTTGAWGQWFSNGDQSNGSKGSSLRVRPVRAF